MTANHTLVSLIAPLAAMLALMVALPVAAQTPEETIRERLAQAVPGLEVRDIRKSEAPGLYEVETNNRDMIYATEDGEYILAGEMLRLSAQGVVNITESSRAAKRAETMAEFGDEGVIRYPAKGEQKAEVAVFTDIDCPYCRKLHAEVPRLNDLGITVNYYAFPRSGPDTPSYHKYVSVWCSDDPRAAMDAAKNGDSVAPARCDNPVQAQFELGSRVDVTGTPAIILEDGNMVRGYVPAEKLAEGLGLM